MDKLVSIIPPCYNGEKYVHRFLDSILNQTYKSIELIFVNDGSTDKTEEIVLGYIPVFEKLGMKLIYRSQTNAGQAAALNEGLKWFTGEYLTWPDSDDYLVSTSIEKRVNFLESHPEYGFVRSNAWYVDFYTLQKIKRIAVLPRRYEIRLFEGFIKGIQYWACGCYLVRSSAFFDVNPGRCIEDSPVGQNVQMLLPLSYKYQCGYIDECLFYYVNTPNSHSRVKRTYLQAVERCNEYYRLLNSTCDKIEMANGEREKYTQWLKDYQLAARRTLALQYAQRDDFEMYEMIARKESSGHCFIPVRGIYYWQRGKNKLIVKLKELIKYVVR